MTPEQKEKKAFRKAKAQREKALKQKIIDGKKKKRAENKPVSQPLKLDFRAEELPILDDDDIVLTDLKTTILEGYEFVSAELQRRVKPKDPALSIEIVVKHIKTKKKQSYGFNYNKMKKALEEGTL